MPGRKVWFDDYEVDFVRRELRKHGVRVGLQRKPFCVLELLLRQPGELVTREELFSFLWPDSHVGFEHGLNTAVNSLRHALGKSSRECHFIETRPGLGYRFNVPVRESEEANEIAGDSECGHLDAYQDCLKGRYLLDRMAEEEIYKAIACFKSAAGEETCCALAHAGIADAYCQLASIGSVCSSQVSSLARSSVEIALRKDSDLAEPHVAAGRVKMLFDWDWKGAKEAANRALALDGRSVSAHILQASLLCTLGFYGEAIEACRRALGLDPLSFPANLQMAACRYAAGDFRNAVDQCWRMLTLSSRFAPAQVLLALSYEQLGMIEEATVEFENAKRGGFQPAAISGLGHLCAVVGDEIGCEHAAIELAAEVKNRYVSEYWSAVICTGRKQTEQAFSLLGRCLSMRDPAMLWLNADTRFCAVREDGRFEKILCAIGVCEVNIAAQSGR